MTDTAADSAGHAFSPTDHQHMTRALELARRGLGHVEPNPMVGAVVADGDRLVALGHHARFGGPHAEAAALAEAGPAARGTTLYVTLEPCCHHGKTPPCTAAIIAAGVRRVVAAMTDPFAQVAGRGFEQLRAAGIEVQVGLLEAEARRLNAPFLKRQLTGRPYVIAKWAMTLDGCLAAAGGDSRWISSPESRQWVHSLRSRVDAVLIGGGTARQDDPRLTVRLEPGVADYGRRPLRIVLDNDLDLSPNANLVATVHEAPLLVATTQAATGPRAVALKAHGAEILQLPAAEGGTTGVDLAALLDELGRRGLSNLLVEGGCQVLNTFFAAGAVDALAVFIAPKLIGGDLRYRAPGPCGLRLMSEAAPLLRPTYTPIGGDLLVQGVLRDY